MFKRNKTEVVQPREFSHNEVLEYYGGRSACEPNKEATVSNNLIPLLAIGPSLFSGIKSASAATGEWAVQSAPVNTIPTGYITDKSLETLATILDPVIQIMVGVSFPLASVIMVGAGFFFMLGQSEKAWDIIFKCGMGYIFINISPMLLEILRNIGQLI